jgi:hypothetical protein
MVEAFAEAGERALGKRVAGAAVGAARKNSEVELWPSQREAARRSTDVKDGGPIEAIVEDMKRLEARKTEIKDRLANAEEPPPLLHPNMAEIYRQRIAALYENLQNDDEKAEAAEVFRTLVDQVTLVPDEAELAIVLRGDRPQSCDSPRTRKTATSSRKPGFWVPCPHRFLRHRRRRPRRAALRVLGTISQRSGVACPRNHRFLRKRFTQRLELQGSPLLRRIKRRRTAVR